MARALRRYGPPVQQLPGGYLHNFIAGTAGCAGVKWGPQLYAALVSACFSSAATYFLFLRLPCLLASCLRALISFAPGWLYPPLKEACAASACSGRSMWLSGLCSQIAALAPRITPCLQCPAIVVSIVQGHACCICLHVSFAYGSAIFGTEAALAELSRSHVSAVHF